MSASDSIEDGGARENNLYVKNLVPDVDDTRLERMFNVRHSRANPVFPSQTKRPCSACNDTFKAMTS